MCVNVSVFADTAVIPAARHSGDYGLRVTADSGNATFLSNQDIDVADAFRARFYMRLDQLELSEGQEMTLFAGRDENGETLFRMILVRADDAFRLGFEVLIDSGSHALLDPETGPVLANGWICVEFSWQADTNQGALTYLLDANPQLGLTNLSNSDSQLATVHLGLLDKGAGGFVDFDDYESRERGPIDALCVSVSEIIGQLPSWPQTQSVLNLSAFIDEACSSL